MEFICIKRFDKEFNLIFEKDKIYEFTLGYELNHKTREKKPLYWFHNYYFKDSVLKEYFISIAEWRQKQIDSLFEDE